MFRSFFLDKRWWSWSFGGSALILFTTWYQVQLDVQINEWFGSFTFRWRTAMNDYYMLHWSKLRRVEAAYRKELVFGEDDLDRAEPPTVRELFGHV